jgi:hypothetical protein
MDYLNIIKELLYILKHKITLKVYDIRIRFDSPEYLKIRYSLGGFTLSKIYIDSDGDEEFSHDYKQKNSPFPERIIDYIKQYNGTIVGVEYNDKDLTQINIDPIKTDKVFNTLSVECGICLNILEKSEPICCIGNTPDDIHTVHAFHCDCLTTWARVRRSTNINNTITCPMCNDEAGKIFSGTYRNNNFFGKNTHLRGLLRYLNTLV